MRLSQMAASVRLSSIASGIAQFLRPDGKRIAVIEQTRLCNRRCPGCQVPELHDAASEVGQTERREIISRIHSWGYRSLSLLGGEPVPPRHGSQAHRWDATLDSVRTASDLGMVVNLTSNGDFLTSGRVRELAESGLAFLTLSLHTYSIAGLDHLLRIQENARNERIVPVITTIFTGPRAERIPGIARYVVKHGVFFGLGIAQEFGGRFSSGNMGLVPQRAQQVRVFDALSQLKRFGMVRTNWNYLRKAVTHFPNQWRCDHTRDSFIHVDANGVLGVCSEVGTPFKALEMNSLSAPQWRDAKQALVRDCRQCLHQCHYEVQNPAPLGDALMIGLMTGIRLGWSAPALIAGKMAHAAVPANTAEVSWELALDPRPSARPGTVVATEA